MRLALRLFGLCCLFTWPGDIDAVRSSALPNALHRYTFQHPQMGTVFKLVFYSDKDSVEASAIAQQLFVRIDELNAIFSDWLPDSELNRLCATAGSGQKIPVSRELFDILRQSKKYSKRSAGAFDVSIGPLTRLWRRSRSLKEMPTADRIAAARQKVGWKNICLFRKGRKVRLEQSGMGLDLGGIAQGWAADECLARLRKLGIKRALVDAGGDIALGDAPPGTRGWNIEIPYLEGEDSRLFLHNCAITSSGGTARFFEHEGQRYSHIVDPRTGMALTHRNVVTVLAPNATTADAWATAISVLGEAGKKQALKSNPKLKIWLKETAL